MNALESEFFEYQATPNEEFSAYFDKDDNSMRIDHIFSTKYLKKLIYTQHSGQRCFKHLTEFAKFLLLIPHSISYCESIFTFFRKICTDGGHNLGMDATQGYPSIRNNIYQKKSSWYSDI